MLSHFLTNSTLTVWRRYRSPVPPCKPSWSPSSWGPERPEGRWQWGGRSPWWPGAVVPRRGRPLWPASPGGRVGGSGPQQHSLGLEQLGVGHALQPAGQQLEGAALRQQHEQAVQGLDQVWVALHVQELQAQICNGAEERGQGSVTAPGLPGNRPARGLCFRGRQGLPTARHTHPLLQGHLACPWGIPPLSSCPSVLNEPSA